MTQQRDQAVDTFHRASKVLLEDGERLGKEVSGRELGEAIHDYLYGTLEVEEFEGAEEALDYLDTMVVNEQMKFYRECFPYSQYTM